MTKQPTSQAAGLSFCFLSSGGLRPHHRPHLGPRGRAPGRRRALREPLHLGGGLIQKDGWCPELGVPLKCLVSLIGLERLPLSGGLEDCAERHLLQATFRWAGIGLDLVGFELLVLVVDTSRNQVQTSN